MVAPIPRIANPCCNPVIASRRSQRVTDVASPMMLSGLAKAQAAVW
jgi:hypothetical protein